MLEPPPRPKPFRNFKTFTTRLFQGSGPDADVDPFEKASKDKSERVAKNELQRLRNIARAKKVSVPGVGLAPIVSKTTASAVSASQDLQKAADLAKKSTASLGKFQEKLPAAMEKKVCVCLRLASCLKIRRPQPRLVRHRDQVPD